MTARLLRTAIIIGFILSTSSAFAQHTYYISKSLGSDSHTSTQAQSKSTPWAHVPVMLGATSQAAAHTPVPGDRFILYGGDTWVAADLGINTCLGSPCSNGTSGSPIYIGVDQTWFSGASWTRPVFNCQNTTCTTTGGALIWLYSDYWIFDNIEFTNYKDGGGSNVIEIVGAGVQVENCYIHAFSRGSGTANSYGISTNFSSGSGGVNSQIGPGNVIDGSDSPNQDFMGGILHGQTVFNNVIRYVYNGMNGIFSDIHGNLVEYNYVAASGDHCNMIFPQDTFSGNVIVIYNNVIRHAGCSGGTSLFTLANSSNTSSVAYQYNNVLYDMGVNSSDGIGSGGHTATGVYYDYNNTVVTTASYCFGNGEAPATKSTTYYENNHCVTTIPPACIGTGTTCVDNGGNLLQTPAQADANTSPQFDQVTASEVYAYSPAASTNSTVGHGNNLASMCSGSLAALCNDTTYPEYNTANHTVVMRSVNARPASGAWDIGAYEFTNLQSQSPQPPTGVQASVQ